MFEKFSTKDLVFIALMGTAWFILDFLVGQWINALTGLFLIGAAVSSIVAGFFVVMLVKLKPKFGTFTITLLIFGLLAFPTGSAGPPGFWPKILTNLLAGLIADIWFGFTKFRTWSIYLGFYIIATALLYSQTFAMIWAGIPNAKATLALMHFVVLGFWIIGTLGLLLGFWVYNKIKNKNVVRQIRG